MWITGEGIAAAKGKKIGLHIYRTEADRNFLKVWNCPVDFLIKKLCLPLHFCVPKITNTAKNWNSVIHSCQDLQPVLRP